MPPVGAREWFASDLHSSALPNSDSDAYFNSNGNGHSNSDSNGHSHRNALSNTYVPARGHSGAMDTGSAGSH